MDCQEYLTRFSDYIDGQAESSTLHEMEDHRADCPRCARYSDTLKAGTALLRSMPPLEVPTDFRPRLEHRILHVEDGDAIARDSLGTGATTVSVLGVALLLALSAWAPVMSPVSSHAPSVDLPPLVVASPPSASFTPAPSGPTFSRSVSIVPATEFEDGIWGNPHRLLWQYSDLAVRRKSQVFLRTGIQ